MKFHFFTANDIEDYRKHYPGNPLIKNFLQESKNLSLEELDQKFFFHYIKNTFKINPGIFESKIYGETGIDGLRLDFNFGLRLDVPEGNFHVRISDFDTGQIFFDKNFSGGRLLSVENYFIRWHVEIFLDDRKIFSHTFNPEGQAVAVMFVAKGLGDMLALLPYVEEFKKIHRCEVRLLLDENLRELVSKLYPNIKLIDKIDFQTYATYYPIMMVSEFPLTPADYRKVSMLRVGGMLFGIDYLPTKNFFQPTEPPVTNEPYVCIAVQASQANKCWHWPGGWDIVVDYLKTLGYRVFCIDKNAEEINNKFTIRKPEGAENFTGNRPLLERANMLSHTEFFIGLSSGLSWLAWTTDCPVVMICGFSQNWFEFYTPYRVANRKICNGCFNDSRVIYVTDNCPYQKNTPREFECQKKISPRMVINAVERLIVDRKLTPPALRRN